MDKELKLEFLNYAESIISDLINRCYHGDNSPECLHEFYEDRIPEIVKCYKNNAHWRRIFFKFGPKLGLCILLNVFLERKGLLLKMIPKTNGFALMDQHTSKFIKEHFPELREVYIKNFEINTHYWFENDYNGYNKRLQLIRLTRDFLNPSPQQRTFNMFKSDFWKQMIKIIN